MKWYWIVLIIIAAIVIGFFVAKAVSKSKSANSGSPRNTDPKVQTPVKVTTTETASGEKKLVVASK